MSQIDNQIIPIKNHTITREMISDIKNYDFYVKKDLVKPINNKIIVIKECSHRNYYIVHVNYVFFERIIKLIKLTNTKLYNEIIKTVEICESNRCGWWEVGQDDMAEYLSEQINRDILMKIKAMAEHNQKWKI